MHEIATIGGGCFWCLDAVFVRLRGVERVISGYSGGRTTNPSYRDICEGATGHAEVVQLSFAPAIIGYRDLLEVFFAIHDPTTLNRQGNDIGTQYRSVIFTHSDEQARVARETIAALGAAHAWPGPIVTQVAPAPTFYPAEDTHADYYANNPRQPYCQAVIAPKLAKFAKQFGTRLK